MQTVFLWQNFESNIFDGPVEIVGTEFLGTDGSQRRRNFLGMTHD